MRAAPRPWYDSRRLLEGSVASPPLEVGVIDRPLTGKMCRCTGCGELFGSPSAFDRHQHDDGRANPCMTRDEFAAERADGKPPRLVWHPTRELWVTRLRDGGPDA